MITQRGAGSRAARIARQTRSGLAGSSTCFTPSSASASTIALATAASAGVVPPSPPAAQGLTGADDYLSQWRWSEEQERDGAAREVAEAVKAELESELR